MITKNSSGGNLSSNYNTVVASDSRQWQARLYSDGTLLDCGISRLTISKGSCGTPESFSIGNIYSSMLNAELLGLSDDIKNTDIEVQIGLDTGSIEWITVGHFIAIEVLNTAYSTTVTGYGFSTAKTSGTFVIPATLTLANIASAIQTATGCTITFDNGITTSYELAGSLENCISCYSGLQVLAHACGGYVVDTNDGNFAIHQFSDTPTLSVTTGRMKQLPNVEELPFEITGVQVTATGQYSYALTTDVAIDPDKTYYTRSGTSPNYVYTEVEEPDVADIGTYYERSEVVYTSGSPIVLYDENANMSATVFNNIYKDIVGYEYRTGTIDLSIGDPRIEGNDVLSVTDVNGNAYTIPCHLVTHTYDGGLLTTVQAVKATSSSDGLATGAPLSQRMDEIGTASAIAKASAESALSDAQSAKTSAESAQQSATTAYNLATQVQGLAQQAQADAQSAQRSSLIASEYASRALGNLSTVQSVAETLTWIAQHGTMALTTDTALDPTHVYFVVDANGDYVVGSTHYSIVNEPDVSDISTYYELTIDESLNNYVGTHLALTSEGLWLLPESDDSYKLLIATGNGAVYTTAGTYIIDSGNNIVAVFGAGLARIGNAYDLHVDIENDGMKIMSGTEEKARFSGDLLSLGDDTGRFEVVPTKTTFYGNNAQEVGFIGQGVNVSGSYEQQLIKNTFSYATPFTVYDAPLSFAPQSNIAFSATVNGTDTQVSIPYQQDYSGTTNNLQIAYTASSHNLSVIYNGSKVDTASHEGSVNGTPTSSMSGTAMKGAPLTFIFKNSPTIGTTITIGMIFLNDVTFTVGTAGSDTRTAFMATTVFRFDYDGDKTITVTWQSGYASDDIYISGVHYYTQGVQVSIATATYDRSYSAPIFSFGSNELNSGYGYATMLGEGLIARGNHQLVIGKYNSTQTSPFVIGYGTSDNARQNIVWITSTGDAHIAVDDSASSGTLEGDLYDALVWLDAIDLI